MKNLKILAFTLILFSCSKSENKPLENNTDPLEIIHKQGEGSLIFGALGDGESYLLEIHKDGDPKALKTTVVHQFNDVKSPINCKLQDTKVRVISLPVGKYTILTNCLLKLAIIKSLL